MAKLPEINTETHRWLSIVDTARPAPLDAINVDGGAVSEESAWAVQAALAPGLAGGDITLQPYSSIVLLKSRIA